MRTAEVALTDDELTALALAADPDAPVDDAAPSFWQLTGLADRAGPLPEWYMPSPLLGRPPLRGWWRWVALVIVVAFVAINAYGLCSTYGPVGFG